MKPIENAPRWMHRAYASAAGYFWLPCPICGEDFGGHERHGKHSLMQTFCTARVVCKNPECSAEAERRNKANDYFRPECTSTLHGSET